MDRILLEGVNRHRAGWHLQKPHLPHATTIMRRRVLRRAGAGTRVYRGLQPGQGWVQRAGDAGEQQGGDDGEKGREFCRYLGRVWVSDNSFHYLFVRCLILFSCTL